MTASFAVTASSISINGNVRVPSGSLQIPTITDITRQQGKMWIGDLSADGSPYVGFVKVLYINIDGEDYAVYGLQTS
jgi:hypothetical protein